MKANKIVEPSKNAGNCGQAYFFKVFKKKPLKQWNAIYMVLYILIKLGNLSYTWEVKNKDITRWVYCP